MLKSPSPARGASFVAYRARLSECRLAEALRLSEERYRSVVEDQTEVISRFTADGRYLFVNDVYCRFFGKTAAELLDTSWRPLVHRDDVPVIEEGIARLSVARPVVVIENRVYSGAGSLHWMQFVNRAFFDAEGRLREIQSVGRDITALKEAGEALSQSRAQLRALLAQVESVREEERKTIAAEIHDQLGATLTAAGFSLSALERRIGDCPDSRDELQRLRGLLGEANRVARELCTRLRPPMLDDLGLVETIRWYLGEWSRTTGIATSSRLARLAEEPAEGLRTDLFRILQELLTNVARHAGAAQVRVVLSAGARGLSLAVSDDGHGFSVVSGRVGYGLPGLRERARRHGGTVSIHPGPPGAAVKVQFPGREREHR